VIRVCDDQAIKVHGGKKSQIYSFTVPGTLIYHEVIVAFVKMRRSTGKRKKRYGRG
jgi:hypothetical protein